MIHSGSIYLLYWHYSLQICPLCLLQPCQFAQFFLWIKSLRAQQPGKMQKQISRYSNFWNVPTMQSFPDFPLDAMTKQIGPTKALNSPWTFWTKRRGKPLEKRTKHLPAWFCWPSTWSKRCIGTWIGSGSAPKRGQRRDIGWCMAENTSSDGPFWHRPLAGQCLVSLKSFLLVMDQYRFLVRPFRFNLNSNNFHFKHLVN